MKGKRGQGDLILNRLHPDIPDILQELGRIPRLAEHPDRRILETHNRKYDRYMTLYFCDLVNNSIGHNIWRSQWKEGACHIGLMMKLKPEA